MTGSSDRGVCWWTNARLVSFARHEPQTWDREKAYAIGVRGGRIVAVVPAAEVGPGERVDVEGRWITPGLIDCHTHLVYGGNRSAEWELRLTGVPYAEIARRGGGILNTVRATRLLDENSLVESARPRLRALLRDGVTTVEIKSGYGLTADDEIKMLRVARALEASEPVSVSPTLLAAHAVPPEFTGRASDYADLIVEKMIPAVAELRLADAVDAFCEPIAFSPALCDRVWSAARRHGLAVKGHVEQLTNQHGAELLARHQAVSADHLEYLDEVGVRALAASGTVAVLLPGAYYFLREPCRPPVDLLRAAGVPMAVATDLNPGTSPFASIRWAMNAACVLFGLTPWEALAGATVHAAAALGRAAEIGTLEPGKRADFVVWDVESPAEIVCSFGVQQVWRRVFGGEVACVAP
jgi:imidazolonepropionase